MSRPGAGSAASELVPIAERLRYLQLFRFAVAAVVGLFGALSSRSLAVPTVDLVLGTAAFLLLSLAGYGFWHISRRRGITLFGALLILDGFYLAWVSYATGGSASQLRYLILLHLITVALLASYRTGLKLALWHSLLLWVAYQAQSAGLLRPVEATAQALPGSELERLLTFAATFWFVAVATASFSAVNERELRRRRYDLEALAEMAASLEGARDSLAVGDRLLERVVDTFGFERAVLLATREDNVSLLASHGPVEPAGAGAPPPPASVLRRAGETRETVLASRLDADADPWLSALLPSARNLVLVPLSADGRSIGVLVVEHAMRRGSRIERRVVGMLERFASHGALALRNGWLLDQVQELADTDPLTRIANRRTFERTLERELSRAARGRADVSLVMLDIDHFKLVNDTHGHQAGDEILRRVARAVHGECRDFDTAARYGGEELAVILPGSSASEAQAVAERLRRTIASSDAGPPVTVSAGVANFPTNALDGESLIRAADEALYESKRRGRDRVTGSRRDVAALGGLATAAPAGASPQAAAP